jgi:acetate kinase
MPVVAVFDTAFHAGLPARARSYALPRDLAQRHRIRRFGFHGTSCRAVLARYSELTGIPPAGVTAVVLHLGSGASATAVRNGESIDTSMGFTPLEGLVMGTRAGDLDPALVGHLARAERVPVERIEDWLNTRSGLLGISGATADMRELLARAATDAAARLAVEMFCYRARKYVGAYLAALGGAQAVIFTGAIGEHAAEVRAGIADDLGWCGLQLDPVRNAAATGTESRISVDGARLAAWVIPTDEAGVIARDTAACLERAAT